MSRVLDGYLIERVVRSQGGCKNLFQYGYLDCLVVLDAYLMEPALRSPSEWLAVGRAPAR